MSKKPILGNFATMDGAITVAAEMLAADKAAPKGDTLRNVPLDALRPSPSQVRAMETDSEVLQDLKASILVHGVLEPVLARRTVDGLELLAGHRRVAAARLAGLPAVPVRILEDVADPDAAAITATENLAREDLTPWETMRALATLRDAWKLAGRRVTGAALASAAGRSAGAVSEALGVADAFPPDTLTGAGLDLQRLKVLPWRDLVRAARSPDPLAALGLLAGPLPAPASPESPLPHSPSRRGRSWALRLTTDATGSPRATLTGGGDPATLDPSAAQALLDAIAPLTEILRARVLSRDSDVTVPPGGAAT